MLLTISYSESAYAITPVETLEPSFWDNSKICSLFSRKQQQIFTTSCDNINCRTSVPDYPRRIVESKSLRLFCNFGLFCLLYIHINNNKFTYDKFKNAKFGFSILDMF